MAIFNKNTTELIEYGVVFEGMADGRETAIKMYQEAVRFNAVTDDDIDVLAIFYGNDIYEKITGATHAVESICVAAELKKFHKNIQKIGSMLDSENGWAKAGVSVAPLKSFFAWLAKGNKFPRIEDISILKSVTKILEGGVKATYKVTENGIKDLEFYDLVERILSGEISVCKDGDLTWR